MYDVQNRDTSIDEDFVGPQRTVSPKVSKVASGKAESRVGAFHTFPTDWDHGPSF